MERCGVPAMVASIHPRAWKRNSANFALTAFSEAARPRQQEGAAERRTWHHA
jgi:hypothetical protein